ncbi:MAG: lysophospholipase [Terrimicrobiaceae bacterium]|nr:lysophospholipase [Terrimicrobiaceae bacterium]
MKLAMAVAALVAVAAAFWLWIRPAFQRSLTFFPSRETSGALDRAAAAADFERWKDAGGRPLGWRSKYGDPRRPVVIFHGNAGHALHRLWLAALVQEASPAPAPAVHILEYPGYGDRPGAPSQQAFTRAACEALAALPAPAVVVGESIGTGVAAQAAARCPSRIRGLILLTPFDSLVNVAAFHYPFLPVRLLMADRFDSAAALKGFQGPAAFLIAEEDEVTPAAGGQALFEAFPGPKRLWLISGARHNDAAAMLPRGSWAAAFGFAFGEASAPGDSGR